MHEASAAVINSPLVKEVINSTFPVGILPLPDTSSSSVSTHTKPKEKSQAMEFLGFRNVSKVLVGDIQILIASLLFGFGFIGQRTVSVDGLGPMTCNAFRFTLSAIMIFVILPVLETNNSKSTSGNGTSDSASILNIFRRICQRFIASFKNCLVTLSRLSNANTNANQTSPAAQTPETMYTNDNTSTPLLSHDSPPKSLDRSNSNNNSNGHSKHPHKPHTTPTITFSLIGGEESADEGTSNKLGTTSSSELDLEANSNNSFMTSPLDSAEDSATSKYYRDLKHLKRNIIFWGIVLGLINFLGSGFQQFGIFYTTANKVAFISGFDLFFTPVLTYFIPTLKNNGKPSLNIWIAVGFSICGLYLLSDMNIIELSMGHGEFFAMISALFWSLHIIYTDMATSYIDSVAIIAIQALIVGVLSLILAIATESMPWLWYHFFLVMPWLLCLSLIEALGLVFMIKGQKYSPPTHAAIITSLEGVFASIGSYMFLGETLSTREIFGCLLMLTAAIITEIKITVNPPNGKKLDDGGEDSDDNTSLIELTTTSEEHTHRQ